VRGEGLDTIAQEAMSLVTDGMAMQLGTSSKISEAAQARKADGFQAAPVELADLCLCRFLWTGLPR